MTISIPFKGATSSWFDDVDVLGDGLVEANKSDDAEASSAPTEARIETATDADVFVFEFEAAGQNSATFTGSTGMFSGIGEGGWVRGEGFSGITGGLGGGRTPPDGGWTGGGGGGWTPPDGGWTPPDGGWTGGGGGGGGWTPPDGGWTPGGVDDALDALEPTIVTITVDGIERSFGIIMPADFDPNEVYSAIMTFHGGGDVGTDPDALAAMTGFSSYENPAQFIEIYPQAEGDTWSWDPNDAPYDDVAFIEALCAEVIENWNVDPDNLYAAGVSGGAMMVQSLALEVPDLFEGYAVVAANMMPVLETEAVAAGDDVPMILFQGTEDPGMPYDGMTWSNGYTIMYGVEESADFWADRNNTEMGEFEDMPDLVDDGMSVMVRSSTDGTIEQYVVVGGGHTWPGSIPGSAEDISASELIVDFFEDFGF